MSERDDFATEIRGDDDGYVERRRPAVLSNKLAVIVAGLSILGNVATVFWWSGRIDQRLTANEIIDEKQDVRIHQLAVDNARQDSFIAASNVQYAEIMRRLGSIEDKLDRRR
jgi:hypothetical protein